MAGVKCYRVIMANNQTVLINCQQSGPGGNFENPVFFSADGQNVVASFHRPIGMWDVEIEAVPFESTPAPGSVSNIQADPSEQADGRGSR